MMQRMVAWAFRFVVAVWSMAIISWPVYQTFRDVTLINNYVVAALTAVLGIPTAAAGIAALVKWRQIKERGYVGIDPERRQ